MGLFVGVVHALAFAAPLLSAWAKETIFDAQVAPACPTDPAKEPDSPTYAAILTCTAFLTCTPNL